MPPVNTSFPGYMAPPSVQLTLWSYDTLSREWENYDVGSASQGQLQRRPSGGAWAEAPDLGLSFYLGGKVDGGSEYDSLWLGSNSEVLPGMVVIETSNELSQARNVSTDAVATGRGRIGGSLQYLPGVGSQGVLALIGGGEAPTGVVGNVTYGDLVCCFSCCLKAHADLRRCRLRRLTFSTLPLSTPRVRMAAGGTSKRRPGRLRRHVQTFASSPLRLLISQAIICKFVQEIGTLATMEDLDWRILTDQH